jgi:hypothetical protein
MGATAQGDGKEMKKQITWNLFLRGGMDVSLSRIEVTYAGRSDACLPSQQTREK